MSAPNMSREIKFPEPSAGWRPAVGRAQACPGCTWQRALAPGVIDGPYSRHSRFYVDEIGAFLKRHAFEITIALAFSFLLGLLAGILR